MPCTTQDDDLARDLIACVVHGISIPPCHPLANTLDVLPPPQPREANENLQRGENAGAGSESARRIVTLDEVSDFDEVLCCARREPQPHPSKRLKAALT